MALTPTSWDRAAPFTTTSLRPRASTPPGGDPAAVEGALLARLAAGERETPLAELYDRYGGRLYGLGIRLLGDATAAEELVQETFVRLWRSAGRYDGATATPRTWILMIARRVAVDLQRRAAARPQAAVHLRRADGEHEDPVDDLPARDELERSLLALDVREAMTALPDIHRQVLELGYDDDLSQAEIADRLDVPLGTVKTRTYHALRGLRDLLEAERLL